MVYVEEVLLVAGDEDLVAFHTDLGQAGILEGEDGGEEESIDEVAVVVD